MRTRTYHIFVSGRVQGVGYRRFAQKQALSRSLRGWARNLVNGQVEIQVKGPEEDLEQYCEALKKGPPFSQVRDVVVKSLNEDLDEDLNTNAIDDNGFEVRPDSEPK